MRELILLLGFAMLLMGFSACNNGHSKAFQTIEKEAKTIEQKIQETNDCEELRLFSFSILGLKSDVENLRTDGTIKEGEIDELYGVVDCIEAMWNGKLTILNCQEPTEDDSEIDTSGESDDFADYNIL